MPLSDAVVIPILASLGLPLFYLAGQVIKKAFRAKDCKLLVVGASLCGVVFGGLLGLGLTLSGSPYYGALLAGVAIISQEFSLIGVLFWGLAVKIERRKKRREEVMPNGMEQIER
ncbi:MAG: hypothetical protein QKV96_gp37 [Methanophagales virus GBV303]|uniref:Uncharacterized protein n=1 Tax=Methanophagales virus GBV303 TaxID=2986514 RepID=A0A9E8VBX6_9VIRU|nr:MAG: hypothetical protein QKV96_gp37 [Methanophagales virus GBV303]WAE39673.1 MAG: hypothetical protein NNKAGPMP_00037 [Methanophagales virus GBV303]